MRRDDDFAREIDAHLALETERLIDEGHAPATARSMALKRFGNVTGARERFHDSRRMTWLEDLRRDVAYSVRALRRSPGFTAIAILTLALGIGANAAIFSLTDQVLVRPLPVADPDTLVLLDGPGPYQGSTRGDQSLSVPMFRGLEQASRPVLSGVFARYGAVAAITAGGEPERVSVELVSGGYFTTLGIDAALGRSLGPEDDRMPDAHPVVVLSHAYWQRRFGGDARVLGRDVRVNGRPMVIVGVAPAGFAGVDRGTPTDLFVPLMMKAAVTPTWNDLDEWRSRWVTVFGRLRPDTTREQAAAALDVGYRQLLQEDIKTAFIESAGGRARFLAKDLLVHPGGRGRSGLRKEFGSPLIALMGMVGIVLLIASVNVANLLLARAATQQKEVAIRMALGAGRRRVVRQRLTESLLLAAGGAVAGLLLSTWMTKVLVTMLPFDGSTPALSAATDHRVVLFASSLAAITALLCGLMPALHATRPSLPVALRQESGRVAGSRGQRRVFGGLVVAQVALSLLLLAGASLFARSLYNLRTVDPGFVADHLLQLRLDAALNGYAGPRLPALVARLDDELRAIPGVVSVSLASVPAMSNSMGAQTVKVQGYTPTESEDMSPGINFVGPDYFATMGIPIVAGREFRLSDVDGAPRVAVINETMARYFWKGENPIGRRFSRPRETGTEIEVVGVVKDFKFANARDDISRFYFIPYTQAGPLNGLTFYVRHRSVEQTTAEAARRAVTRVDASLPLYDLMPVAGQVDESMFVERLVASLSIVFGGLAMALAAVGLYGVMSQAVARRRREIGIRMALGAERVSVLWHVLREVLVRAAAGIVLGLPVTLGAGRLVQSQLFGLAPTDPTSITAAAFALIVVAVLAGCAPAIRAMRVDPLVALREE